MLLVGSNNIRLLSSAFLSMSKYESQQTILHYQIGTVQIQVSNATVFQKPHAVLKILKFSAGGHLANPVFV